MKSPIFLKAPVRHTLVRIMGIWMIAALLVGAAWAVQPAGKAQAAPSCATTTTSVADGDWNTSATWNNGVPSGATCVVIDGFDVTVSGGTIAAQSLTISQTGVLRFDNAATLNLASDGAIFDVVGTFDDHVGGTVSFSGISPTINTHGNWVDFSNLTVVVNGKGDVFSVDAGTGTGGIKVFDTLSLNGDSAAGIYLGVHGVGGTAFLIDAQGPRSVNYLDVVDSNNVGDPIGVANLTGSNQSGWVAYTNAVALKAFSVSGDELNAGSLVMAGDSVTLTAAITSNTEVDEGAVDFYNGTAKITSCQGKSVETDEHSNSTASCVLSFTGGTQNLTAKYMGSTSNTVTLTASKFTSTSLMTSASPSISGNAVTYTAVVMPMAAGGNVAFKDGGSAISGCAAVALMNGMATCQVTYASAGSHSVTAEYSTPAAGFTASFSAPMMQNVMGTSSVSLSTGGTHGPLHVNQSVTFTAVVTPSDATGTVTFRSNGTDIPGCVNVAVSAGQASCAVKTMIARQHNITAIYSGDATHLTSTSSILQQLITLWQYFLTVIKVK